MGSNTHIKHRDMPLIWSQQEIIPARGRWGTWAWQGSLMRISKREVGVVPDVCFTKPAQHTSTSEHHRLAPDLCPLTPAWQKQCGDCQTHQYRPPRFPQKGLSRCRGHLSACSLFCWLARRFLIFELLMRRRGGGTIRGFVWVCVKDTAPFTVTFTAGGKVLLPTPFASILAVSSKGAWLTTKPSRGNEKGGGGAPLKAHEWTLSNPLGVYSITWQSVTRCMWKKHDVLEKSPLRWWSTCVWRATRCVLNASSDMQHWMRSSKNRCQCLQLFTREKQPGLVLKTKTRHPRKQRLTSKTRAIPAQSSS